MVCELYLRKAEVKKKVCRELSVHSARGSWSIQMRAHGHGEPVEAGAGSIQKPDL